MSRKKSKKEKQHVALFAIFFIAIAFIASILSYVFIYYATPWMNSIIQNMTGQENEWGGGGGAGTVPDSPAVFDCPQGMVYDNGEKICYPIAVPGYSCFGASCSVECPLNTREDHINRESCIPEKTSDFSASYSTKALCEAAHGKGKCTFCTQDQLSLTWYQKCPAGFERHEGVCGVCEAVCYPQENFVYHNGKCKKNRFYIRGPGVPVAHL